MKVVLSACVLTVFAVALGALGAPAPTPAPSAAQGAPGLQILERQPELYRDKRSHFGGGVPYYSGCGSAPIAAIAPAYHSPAHAYSHAYSTHSYSPQGYGYIPQYRSTEEPDMDFHDMEPMMSDHMSRFAYAPAPAHYGGAALPNLGGLVTPVTTGPAFGVFPNARPGGCAVPLLLSCSPSIVQGRIVNAHPSPAYAAGQETYRADEMGTEETEAQHQHQHQHHHQPHEQQPLDESAQENVNINQ